ncbi:MAG: oligopeptide ABC transporter permease [Dethiobacteria bacterium]|nr:ABC transporter permease [Bacillota bacterium]HPT34412.1 ABC transporter permease [Bacillota bacterium]HPZ64599.1 ABC transporter permease [Bacillota bacterium]
MKRTGGGFIATAPPWGFPVEEGPGPLKTVWSRFKRNKIALAALFILLALILLSLLAPVIAPHPRDYQYLSLKEAPPSRAHPLGNDSLGRDNLTRLLYGGRVSLAVGLGATALQLSIGILLGALAGYYGKFVDTLVMRLADTVLSFPSLALALTAAAVFGPSVYNTILIIGLLSWTETCRLVRGQFLSLKEANFVLAARSLGLKEGRIIFRHLLPNALAPLLISATFSMAGAILIEAGLSFLGMGVPRPTPSWGNMLEAARNIRIISSRWWIWLPPGLMIFLAVLSINLIGDGLRDALDPRQRR